MVQTRRQYHSWVASRGDNYQSSQESCSECASQASQHSSHYSFDYDSHPFPSYSANDHCKRHRKPDNEPYTEEVVAYSRRKPHH